MKDFRKFQSICLICAGISWGDMVRNTDLEGIEAGATRSCIEGGVANPASEEDEGRAGCEVHLLFPALLN